MLKRAINKVGQIVADLAYQRIPKPLSAFHEAKKPESSQEVSAHSAFGSIYWVGHSLMQEQVETTEGTASLFIWMNRFAEFHGLPYRMFDHTLWGAPLSLQWRGRAHSFERSAHEMQEKRDRFRDNASNYSDFVFTEVVPLRKTQRLEFTAWYLRAFCRTVQQVTPQARLYVYESWDYFQTGAASLALSQSSWRERMLEQRGYWEEIVAAASTGCVVEPNWLQHLKIITGLHQNELSKPIPIHLIPVGQAFIELYDRLRVPRESDDFRLASGQQFQFHQLFSNAYIEETVERGEPRLVHPEKPFDDIHAGEVGIYLVALVHFAVLYQCDPKGLPKSPILGEGFARTLQTITWDVVNREP